MATQRLMIATLAGEAVPVTAELFASWRRDPAPAAVDRFCTSLRENGAALPVVYFSEWLDRWLMGNQVPGPDRVEGSRFEATCLSRTEAREWAGQINPQHQEHGWLIARLREAAAAWEPATGRIIVVVVREALGGSVTDEELVASLDVIPAWLSDLTSAP